MESCGWSREKGLLGTGRGRAAPEPESEGERATGGGRAQMACLMSVTTTRQPRAPIMRRRHLVSALPNEFVASVLRPTWAPWDQESTFLENTPIYES